MLQRGHRGLAESLACLGATLAGLLQLRLYIMGSQPPEFASSDNPAARSPSLITRFLTFAYLPVVNLGLLVWPRWLSFDWSMDAIPRVKSLADPRNALSLLFYYLLVRVGLKLYLILRHRRRRRNNMVSGVNGLHRFLQTQRCWASKRSCPVCRFYPTHHVCHNNNNLTLPYRKIVEVKRRKLESTAGLNSAEILLVSLSFLVVPFLPATNLFFYVGFVVAERVLYIPSVGYSLLLGLGSWELWRRAQPSKRRAFLVAGLVLLAAFSARTVQRNQDWACEESLYRSGIPINPPKCKYSVIVCPFGFKQINQKKCQIK
ncbi:hypothetical protein B566_EDAN009893 [Ephemera danica]|nr:hypothetical protein B566_EDAN009893 [Ephemera danica]